MRYVTLFFSIGLLAALDPHATGGSTVVYVNDSGSKSTVGAVARLVGVSVRTLHHYDDIGLVVPSGRTNAGYRTYSDADVERLYSVLSYRALGFPLEEIQRLLDDPTVDALEHLRRQRALLDERIGHLQSMATALDKMMEEKQVGNQLSPDEMREIWGNDWIGDEYETEAQERWGDTDAWRQSRSRTAEFTKNDWARIKTETEQFEADIARAMRDGVVAGSPEADVLAERHRLSIDRYYDCSLEMQVCVAAMYTSDPRFQAHYDQLAGGLAAWLVDVVNANARKHGVNIQRSD